VFESVGTQKPGLPEAFHERRIRASLAENPRALLSHRNKIEFGIGRNAIDSPTFEELCETAGEQLFDKIKLNSNHVLNALLPPPSVASQNYNLRRRPHTLSFPAHNTSLSDCNFITRILYKECY